MLRFLCGILILGSAIIILISLYTFFLYTHPKRYITPITPKDLNLEYEEVSFQSKDGIALSGWFIPNRNSDAVIVVCHGYPADKGDILTFASFLNPYYSLFFFDFRAMGRSGGRVSTVGYKEKMDFLSAVDYVKKRGFEKIGAFGFSMGGSVIIMSNSTHIKAAVTDSAFASLERLIHSIYANFGFLRYPFVFLTKLYAKLFYGTDIEATSPLKYIKDLKFPLFIIHAESDEIVPVENAYILHNANLKNRLWIIPQSRHGQLLNSKRKEYQERVIRFFKAHL